MEQFRKLPGWVNLRTIGIGLALAALVVIFGGHLFEYNGALDFSELIKSLWANVGAELGSIALTVLVIDTLNQRRANVQEKETLIAQLGSRDNFVTRQAIKILWVRNWLRDGSTQGAYLWEANLQEADLGECDLRRTELKRANLRRARLWARLEGADLTDADLEGAMFEDPYVPDRPPAQFDKTTILPDSANWTQDTDMSRFTDSAHPDFWRSDDSRSPAFRGEGGG